MANVLLLIMFCVLVCVGKDWQTRLDQIKRDDAIECVLHASQVTSIHADVGVSLFDPLRSGTLQFATFCAWIKLDEPTAASVGAMGLFGQPGLFSVGLAHGGQLSVLYGGDSTWSYSVDQIEPFGFDWTHVAFVVGPLSNDVGNVHALLYKNGVAFQPVSLSGTIASQSLDNATLLAVATQHYAGFVSEMMLFNNALSGAQIGQLMRGELSPLKLPGLIGYWRTGKPCFGDILVDSSVFGRNATLKNAAGQPMMGSDVYTSQTMPPVCAVECSHGGVCINASCQCVPPFAGSDCRALVVDSTVTNPLKDHTVCSSLHVGAMGTLTLLGSLTVEGDAIVGGSIVAAVQTHSMRLDVGGSLYFCGSPHIAVTNAVPAQQLSLAAAYVFGSYGGLGPAHVSDICGGSATTNNRLNHTRVCSNEVYGSWSRPLLPGTAAADNKLVSRGLATGSAGGAVALYINGSLIVGASTTAAIAAQGTGGSGGAIFVQVAGSIELTRSANISRLELDATASFGGGGGRIGIASPLPVAVIDKSASPIGVDADAGSNRGFNFRGTPGTVYLESGIEGWCAAAAKSCRTLIVRQSIAVSSPTEATPIGSDNDSNANILDYLIVESAIANFTAPFHFENCTLIGIGANAIGHVECTHWDRSRAPPPHHLSSSSSSPSSSPSTLSTLWIVIIAVGSALLLFTVVGTTVILIRRCRRRRRNGQLVGTRSLDSMSLLSSADFEDGAVHLPLGSAELDAVRQRVGDALIDMREVIVSSQPVAKGAFAAVYRGTYRGVDVAVKMMVADLDDVPIDVFYREVEALATLQHDNVVRFVGALVKPIGVVTEWACHGSLTNAMATQRTRYEQWSLKLSTMLDIARGMSFLHAQDPPLLHRDLKSPNVLVFEGFVAKLADFGLARSQAMSMTMRMGTTRWTAPEVLHGSRYTGSADVYSFAIVCWELMTMTIPFAGMRFTHELEDRIVDGERLPLDGNRDAPPQVIALIHRCWLTDPLARPSFEEICDRLSNI